MRARGPRAGPSRPNILLLFADDQRADTIAAWGNPHIRTPNLDRLARRGTSFRGNYCFGSNSGAVCVPSRAMLMSGRTWLDVPHDLHGVRLLPELLREAGYETFATGKWHNGEASFVRAFPRGRSVFFGGMADHTKVPVADVRRRPGRRPPGRGEVLQRAVRRRRGGLPQVAIRRRAVLLLRGVHRAARPAQPAGAVPGDVLPESPAAPGELPAPAPVRQRHGQGHPRREPRLPRTREVIGDQLCEYYGLITHLDEQVGRILAALEESGHADDTVIIYTADHGLALGSHGLLGKQSLYEHSMRSPLIIAGPGIPAGRSTAAFTYLFDLFPTICALAGAKPPDGLAGRDLRPLWEDENAKIRESVFLPFSGLMRSVRDARWKLIVYPPINHRQLFDLRDDPHETRDLAADPGHEPEIARLTALMRSWQEKLGDEQPLAVKDPKPKEVRFDDFERKPDQWQPAWIVEKYFRGR